MKVYVAGSSRDLPRIKRNMERLREAGIEITHDWVTEIEKVGAANPHEASTAQRDLWARADLQGAYDADLVWLCVGDDASWGAGFEVGYCAALGRTVVTSGPTKNSIFFVYTYEYPNDDEAFEGIIDTARRIDAYRAGLKATGPRGAA